MHRKYGFTLVEMLFVVIIAGAVVAMSIPAYKRAQERARYNAALGQLGSIGGAVQGLNRDLVMDGMGSMDGTGIFPFTESFQITKIVSAGVESGETLRETLADKDNAGRNQVFLGALFQDNRYLLSSITLDSEYQYWAVQNTNSACSGTCNNNGTLICMCKATSNENDCFYGARYLRDGMVQRIRLSGCREGN